VTQWQADAVKLLEKHVVITESTYDVIYRTGTVWHCLECGAKWRKYHAAIHATDCELARLLREAKEVEG
jgi:hypothetical protein